MAYINTISKFIADINGTPPIATILSDMYPKSQEGEINSWKHSLPIFANILKELPEEIKEKCEICLEAGYYSDERADAVIVGKKDGHPVVIIIENKQWSNLEKYSPASDRCLIDPCHDSNYVEHPSYQVSHYKYILDNTNGYCQENNASVYPIVFMHNATEKERTQKHGLFDDSFANILSEVPVFVGKEGTNNSIAQTLNEYIGNNLDDGEIGLAEKIYNSERKESESYKNAIANAFGNKEQLLDLLDENQISIFEEIRKSVLSDQKKVFIVEGNPGTGKTFVAIALLSYLYKSNNTDNERRKFQMILKNKDPRRALIRMGIPKEAVKPSLNGNHNNYDCLICDESHRMLEQAWSGEDDRNNIDVIIEQSGISVFFYDKRQRVHVNDYITADRIVEKAAGLKIPVIKRSLEYQHRCLESDHFMQLIDRILYEPERGLEDIDKFTEDEKYLVRMVNSPRELFYAIKEFNDKKAKTENGSRVLAGKGRSESDGKDWEWKFDNVSLSERKTVGPFRNDNDKYVWNLHKYAEPDSFASVDSSINLVGCIDTSQGLDFEYIGMIIAPDLVYDKTTRCVRVNINGHQQRDPNIDSKNENITEKNIEEIIKNTYRVLASRGKKGCFIYCCDEGLHNYLREIIPLKKVDVPDDYEIYPKDNKIKIIGNRTTLKYHKPDCSSAPLLPMNRVEFDSVYEAIKKGYEPCVCCLHGVKF